MRKGTVNGANARGLTSTPTLKAHFIKKKMWAVFQTVLNCLHIQKFLQIANDQKCLLCCLSISIATENQGVPSHAFI